MKPIHGPMNGQSLEQAAITRALQQGENFRKAFVSIVHALGRVLGIQGTASAEQVVSTVTGLVQQNGDLVQRLARARVLVGNEGTPSSFDLVDLRKVLGLDVWPLKEEQKPPPETNV